MILKNKKKFILLNTCELIHIFYRIKMNFDGRKLTDIRRIDVQVEVLQLNFKTAFVCRA